MKRFQFVWWFPYWQGFSLVRFKEKETDWRYIYDWCLNLGFWEIRKWHRLTDQEKKELSSA